jgi:hypothetical protein
MNTDNTSGYPTYRAKWQFLISFTILWLATGWLLTQGEKWLVIAIRTEDFQEGLILTSTICLLACISAYLLINLYGATFAIILPRNKLLFLKQKLVRYPITMYIFGKAVDHQLGLKDKTL